MILHVANPLGIAYVMTILVGWLGLGLGLENLTLTLTGQQLQNVTPCSDNSILLIYDRHLEDCL